MKNRFYVILSIAVLSVISLFGCDNNEGGGSAETPTSESSVTGKFTVTFKNFDELVLYATEVEKGQTAVYQGDVPTKPATAMNEFVFSGWDRDLTNVTESFTTYAQYNQIARKYTVTFKNYDGTVLQNTREDYGSMPTYHGVTPTRPSDAVADYTFAGWDPEITYVKADAVYTAVYNPSYSPTYRTTGLVYQIHGYNEYYSVIGYFGNDVDVAIPQVFDGVPVKGIKAGAFSGHDKLETIFIPSTINYIEEHAFDNCPAITHLTVGEGNTTYHIDDNGDLGSMNTLVYTLPSHKGSYEVNNRYVHVLSGAFSCSGINTLNISADSFDTLPELFAVDAAHMPSALKSLIIKGGNINDEQFMDCSYLESISLLHTDAYSPVTRVGDRAFKNCTALRSLSFSDEIQFIGDEAFMGCTQMTTLNIGTSENVQLSHVGKDAFQDLPNVRTYDDYSGIRTLGNSVCKDIIAMEPTSKSITEANISQNIVALNSGLFKDCAELKTVNLLGNKLSAIGAQAFMNCTKLQNLYFDMDNGGLDNVDYIPYDAFSGCTQLFSGNTSVSDKSSGKAFYLLQGATGTTNISANILGIDINAFANKTASSKIALDENNKAFVVDNNVLRDIYGNVVNAFFNDVETDAYVGGEITYNSAFAYQHLNSLVIDEGVKTISANTFHDAIIPETKVELPRSLEKIENSAFKNFNNSNYPQNSLYFYTKENLRIIEADAFFGSRSIYFFTPFAENQPGWASGFDHLNPYYYFTINYSYGV